MSPNAIFLPALALMGWTFVILTMILWRRVGSNLVVLARWLKLVVRIAA